MDLEYYLLRAFIEERRLEDEGRMKCLDKFWTEVCRPGETQQSTKLGTKLKTLFH
jgi:hypothetical protein